MDQKKLIGIGLYPGLHAATQIQAQGEIPVRKPPQIVEKFPVVLPVKVVVGQADGFPEFREPDDGISDASASLTARPLSGAV
jgi:hypothetical protein